MSNWKIIGLFVPFFFFSQGEIFSIINSIFSQNVARSGGGAIAIFSTYAGNRILNNDSFSENSVVSGNGTDIIELSPSGINPPIFYNGSNFKFVNK